MRAHALLIGAIEQDLAAAELPPLAWHDVLAALDAAPDGRMRIHELADAIVFSRSGLSRLLDRLEREELLRRERSSERPARGIRGPDGRRPRDAGPHERPSTGARWTSTSSPTSVTRSRRSGIAGARGRVGARGVPGRP